MSIAILYECDIAKTFNSFRNDYTPSMSDNNTFSRRKIMALLLQKTIKKAQLLCLLSLTIKSPFFAQSLDVLEAELNTNSSSTFFESFEDSPQQNKELAYLEKEDLTLSNYYFGSNVKLLTSLDFHPSEVSEKTTDKKLYKVSKVEIKYIHSGKGLPERSSLLQSSSKLKKKGNNFDALNDDEKSPYYNLRLSEISNSNYQFTRMALKSITKSVVSHLNNQGFIGIHAYIDPKDISLTGEDLRDSLDYGLRILVGASVVSELEVLKASADINDPDTWDEESQRSDSTNALYSRIYRLSPVQKHSSENQFADTTSFVQKSLLQDYLSHLNRHPGRRIDVKIKPETYLEASVFFLVIQGKPWHAVYNVNNSGKKWISQVDFIHNQLTNNDDIFKTSYITNDFKDFNSLSVSYQRPFPGSFKHHWEVYWSGNEYESSLGLLKEDPEPEFSGKQFNFGAKILSNLFQYDELFLDLIFDTSFKNLKSKNKLILDFDNHPQIGEAHFITPSAALRLSKITKESTVFAQISAKKMLPTLAKDLYKLNRGDETAGAPNKTASIFELDSSFAFYLEPLINPMHQFLANEVELSCRGQFTQSRLVPQMKVGLGGPNTVRAYPQGVASGDSSYLFSFEYRLHIPRLLPIKAIQRPDNPDDPLPFRWQPAFENDFPDWDFILKLFTDYGKTFNTHYRQTSVPEFNEQLWSYGLGIELLYKSYLQLRSDWAIIQKSPVTRRDLLVGDSRWHINISLMY